MRQIVAFALQRRPLVILLFFAFVGLGLWGFNRLDALRVLNATRLQANQARHAYLLSLVALEQVSGVSGIVPRL